MVGASAQGRQGGWRTVGSKGEEFGGMAQKGKSWEVGGQFVWGFVV